MMLEMELSRRKSQYDSARRNSQRDDRWRHHRSPPSQFRHRAEGDGIILQSPALVISAHKTFGSTDFTSTYSVCTSEGIRTQAFRSGVRCSTQ
ncbi:hypothetical protein TNCV_3653391 [Trichonephila clavipes]|nr:hypothetical protein TNCV_3653391 [Trichonephila clavipes]